jgi:hypothetical protein
MGWPAAGKRQALPRSRFSIRYRLRSNFPRLRADVESNMAGKSNAFFKRICYTGCGEQERKGTKGDGEKEIKGRIMFFLLRTAFWLGVVLVLLPTFAGSESAKPVSAQTQMSAGDAASAAGATVADLVNFCDRQPEACVIGAQAAAVVGERAQAGAKILYDYLNDRSNPKTGSVSVPNASPTSKPAPARKAAVAGRDTLTPADRAPAWRSPVQKDSKRAG